MAKRLRYRYPGTLEAFTARMFSDPAQTEIQLDPYRIERTENGQLRFGLDQGESGGGTWYVNTCHQEDGWLCFSGTIEYIDFHYRRRQKSRWWRIHDRMTEAVLHILLLPLMPLGWFLRKIVLREESDEDTLDRLMVEMLHCEKIQ